MYSSDFDANGLLYWLGTDGGRSAWRNPMDAGRVTVTASSQHQGTPNMVVGREAQMCYTGNDANAWFAVDLGEGRAIQPTHYSLRHWNIAAHALRHWVLEASSDGAAWTALRTHANDTSLAAQAGSTASWPLAADRAYRHFRVRQTGKCGAGYDQLMLSGFEIYGRTELP